MTAKERRQIQAEARKIMKSRIRDGYTARPAGKWQKPWETMEKVKRYQYFTLFKAERPKGTYYTSYLNMYVDGDFPYTVKDYE